MPTLIPIPARLPLEPPPSGQPDAMLQWAQGFTKEYNTLYAILRQDVNRLASPQPRPGPGARASTGHGLGEHLLTGEPMTLVGSAYRDGLILADGADRGKINVSFRYLGIGPIIVGSGATVTYTADFANPVGGPNGLDTGAEAANTWYYVFMIAGENNGDVVDTTTNNWQPPCRRKGAKVAALLSTSATPLLPSGFNRYRRVGMVRNDNGSNLYRAYYFADGWTIWNEDFKAASNNGDFARVTAGNPAANTWTGVSCVKIAPPTATAVRVHAYASSGVATSVGMNFAPTGSNWTVGATDFSTTAFESGIASRDGAVWVHVPCNTAQSIDYAIQSTNNTVQLWVTGFYDPV